MQGQVRLLPVLIFIALLAFSVRLAEVVTGISHLSGTAYAEEKKAEEEKPPEEKPSEAKPEDVAQEEKKEEPEEEKKAEEKVPDDEKAEAKEGDKKEKSKAEEVDVQTPKWQDASDADTESVGIKMELLEELSQRRKDLDEKDKTLKVQEALLKAATQELDRKYQELEKLRKEIEGLLGKQSEQEDARIGSLVKIYEGMKPQDAARIFDTLDLDVLVSVLTRMSERKVSPVLAAMNPERARTITIMMAEQKQLPSLPEVAPPP